MDKHTGDARRMPGAGVDYGTGYWSGWGFVTKVAAAPSSVSNGSSDLAISAPAVVISSILIRPAAKAECFAGSKS